MLPLARRRLLIAVAVVALVLVAVGILIFAQGDLKSRSALISVGMPRAEVEGVLGPPVLTLPRSSGKGEALIWTDQFWQLSVVTGADGRTESIECVPSDSLYRRTLGRVVSYP
jgi:hypothetical protein